MRGGGGGSTSRLVAWDGRWTIQRFLFLIDLVHLSAYRIQCSSLIPGYVLY